MNDEVSWKKVAVYIILGLTAFFSIIAFFSSMDQIQTGFRGVVYSFGKAERVVDEGIYFTNPFTTDVEEFEIRTKKLEVEAQAASKDLQSVAAKVAVNYALDPAKLLDLVRSIGKDYEGRVLNPSIVEAIKSSTAKFTAEELVTKRADVRDAIQSTLVERMTPYGVRIDGINITDFDFSASFNAAIEGKVTAEQEALKSKNQLARIEYEGQQRVKAALADKDAAIAKAQGEAEAIRIQSEAIQKNGGESYVKLKWIEKWNGALPTTSLGENTPLVNVR